MMSRTRSFIPLSDRISNDYPEVAVGPATILIAGVPFRYGFLGSDMQFGPDLPLLRHLEFGSASCMMHSYHVDLSAAVERRMLTTKEWQLPNVGTAA
jgi:hypothetical protein